MKKFKSILYPVALTDISPKVAPYVVTLAKQLDVPVHLIHVLRPFGWFVDNFLTELSETDSKHIGSDVDSQLHSLLNLFSDPDSKRVAGDFESQVQKQAQQKLQAFKERYLSDVNIADTVVVSGTRHKQILEYVKSEGIDLIIMGAETSVQKVMFGSVVEKVSKLAAVPVVIVKCDRSE
jgi:nucleotide-binding universal stress UspA family protein